MAKKGKKKGKKSKARQEKRSSGKRSGGKRSGGKRSGGKRKKRDQGLIDKAKMSGTDVVIALATGLGVTLLNRANAKAVKEAGGDESKAKFAWWRKMNVVKALGTTGNLGAATTAVALLTDVPYLKGVAAGLDVAAGIQIANHGGFFKKEEPSTAQGQLLVAGVDDRLAMGGEVLAERVDLVE